MGPEQQQAGARLAPESAGSSRQPGSADERRATLIQVNQEEMVDELTSDLWRFDGPWLRRTYPLEGSLRRFVEAFVEALRRSFTAAGGKPCVKERAVRRGR